MYGSEKVNYFKFSLYQEWNGLESGILTFICNILNCTVWVIYNLRNLV